MAGSYDPPSMDGSSLKSKGSGSTSSSWQEKERGVTDFALTTRRNRLRWYGRLEDGYIEWTSVYLYEYFGFKYYEPLPLRIPGTPQVIPPWLTDFYSLPNLAIPMSYFCVGVALQLLRTPLIVYFIADLNATPAEV